MRRGMLIANGLFMFLLFLGGVILIAQDFQDFGNLPRALLGRLIGISLLITPFYLAYQCFTRDRSVGCNKKALIANIVVLAFFVLIDGAFLIAFSDNTTLISNLLLFLAIFVPPFALNIIVLSKRSAMLDHKEYRLGDDHTTSMGVGYAGFWVRVGATIIDTLLIMVITFPLVILIYGWQYFDLDNANLIRGPADFLISWIFPAVVIIWFWAKKQATPGKMLLSLQIRDADTGNALTLGQCIRRYLAYFVSAIPLGLGLIWVGFDSRKQGWHDKLANTIVVRTKKHGPEPVSPP